MKNNSRNNWIRKAILLVAIAIIISGLTRIIYNIDEAISTYDIKEINATFIIGRNVGLAVDSDSLNFGMATPGGNVERKIVLYHEYEKPLKVKIIYTGDIAPLLSPIDSFYLEPKTEKNVSITAYAIAKEYRSYSGTVKVIYIKT